MPIRSCFANICCERRRINFVKGTSSTVGTRRWDAACELISRTTTSGCRWRFAATSTYRGDAIPQSWSVLSGAGTPERSELAVQSLDRRLIRRDAQIILRSTIARTTRSKSSWSPLEPLRRCYRIAFADRI